MYYLSSQSLRMGSPSLRLGGRVLSDSSTTFKWLVRNRYFPLRKGEWRTETAKAKVAQIEIDLIAKFGEYPLNSFDRLRPETHGNDLALRSSQNRVKQARSYLTYIFDEVIEQEFLMKDSTRKLKIPKNLRPKGQAILSGTESGCSWQRRSGGIASC